MKVCIGLSGGVDSSVAALLLKQQGHDVFALFMQNWHDTTGTLHGDCEWEEDRFVAELVARKIGIPFYFVDLSEEYRKRVVDYMFDEYSKGRTPNPDVLCNREIKFDAFLKTAKKLGAEKVATGHYCRKDSIEGPDGSAIHRIFAGSDPNKDQSYFLCQLTQEQLADALFPIGDITKPEVRRIAKEADLPSADKKDSQGICFVGKVDLPTFLQQKLKPATGRIVEVYDSFFESCEQYRQNCEILGSLLREGSGALQTVTSYISEDKGSAEGSSVRNDWDTDRLAALSDEDWLKISRPLDYGSIRFETESYRSGKKHIRKTRYKENPWGKIIGEHDGAQFYTIGQRKGLNVGGHKDSVFVIGTDIEENVIYVGEGHRHKGLSRSVIRLLPEEVHWIRKDLAMEVGEIRRYKVRVRYRQPLQEATLVLRGNGLFIIFDTPQRGITPGQFAVWYDENLEMLGSSVI
ncbi:MAG: tRNA 2-thiouridine(34) synthase MnmA [Bacteroidales bacterium]|nr:tRNA 2-thiouridine(34) synthase MnmA [Bacteroidales bacterium]